MCPHMEHVSHLVYSGFSARLAGEEYQRRGQRVGCDLTMMSEWSLNVTFSGRDPEACQHAAAARARRAVRMELCVKEGWAGGVTPWTRK